MAASAEPVLQEGSYCVCANFSTLSQGFVSPGCFFPNRNMLVQFYPTGSSEPAYSLQNTVKQCLAFLHKVTMRWRKRIAVVLEYIEKESVNRGIFGFFFMYFFQYYFICRRFNCVGGFWDRTHSARSPHPIIRCERTQRNQTNWFGLAKKNTKGSVSTRILDSKFLLIVIIISDGHWNHGLAVVRQISGVLQHPFLNLTGPILVLIISDFADNSAQSYPPYG
jgi:hypothetical protein